MGDNFVNSNSYLETGSSLPVVSVARSLISRSGK